MRIVIVGGAFNPPTLAHIALAEEARERVEADLVIFVPSKANYMKTWKKYQEDDIYADETRRKAVLACECEWLKVDTCEMDGTVSGKTYDTIKYIKEKYQTDEVYFAIGSDKLTEISRWAMATELISSEKFIVMQRNGDDVDSIIMADQNLARNASSFLICKSKEECQFYSSTLVRKYLASDDPAEHEKAREIIPSSVWDVLVKENTKI